MGDLGHPINCRKRKLKSDSDEDENTPTNDDMLVDPPPRLSNAPRQPPSISTDAVWPSDPSPIDPTPDSRTNKRPRVDTSFKTQRRQFSSARTPSSPRSPWRSFRKTDSPSLLKIDPHCPAIDSPTQSSSSSSSSSSPPTIPPVDLSSPHIPSMHPLINRQTLKELDLDSILRNPQLRQYLSPFSSSNN